MTPIHLHSRLMRVLIIFSAHLSITVCLTPTCNGDDAIGVIPRVPLWTPPVTATHVNLSGETKILEGDFDIVTHVKDLGKVTCAYIIPLSHGGIPAPTAPDMVLRFGWLGQNALATGEASRLLATKYGFTVLTIIWPKQHMSGGNDRTISVYPESGSGANWIEAIANVRIIGRLPKRKVFAIGFSAGASAAHQFAEEYPNSVEAVVAIAGRTFVDKPRFLGPTLLLHSIRDRVEENTALTAALRKLGAPVLHLTFSPNWTAKGTRSNWDHRSDNEAWDLSFQWLAALAEQRQFNKGILLPESQWPLIDGNRVPGMSCRRPMGNFMVPPKICTDPGTGRLTIVTMPVETASRKGTILWMDRRSFCNEDEILAPAELLAAHGYRCVATMNDEDQISEASMQAMWQHIGIAIPPIHLVLVEPLRDDMSALSHLANRCAKVELIRPYASRLPIQIATAENIGLKMAVLAQPSVINGISPSRKSNRLLLVPMKEYETPGEWFAQELDFVLTAINR